MVTIDPREMVRLLISDTDATSRYFSDTEIVMFLSLTVPPQSVKRAAASALDAIASNETLVAKYITDHQITVDGTKVAADLRKHADTLRAEAADDEARGGDDAFFDIVPPACSDSYGTAPFVDPWGIW